MFRTVIKPIKLFCLDSSNIRQLNISPIGIETIFFFGIGSGIEKHEEEDSGQIFLGQMLPDKLNSFTKLVFDCSGTGSKFFGNLFYGTPFKPALYEHLFATLW